MNRASLQRYAEIHRAFAGALQGHLRRHWQRDLSQEEANTVQNYTLCGSFMALESMDRALSQATSSEKASQDYLFMHSEVARNSQAVIEEIQRRLSHAADAPQPSAYANLLTWEEALVEYVSKNGL